MEALSILPLALCRAVHSTDRSSTSEATSALPLCVSSILFTAPDFFIATINTTTAVVVVVTDITTREPRACCVPRY